MNNGIINLTSNFIRSPLPLLGRPLPLPTIDYRAGFSGNLNCPSIFDAAIQMSNNLESKPIFGGQLTINGEYLGYYDYVVKSSSQKISNFIVTDWFTSTQDTRSAWCVVNGDLTIDSGITFIPSVRKLFTVVLVTGNLILNGSISMTARGANHNGTGSDRDIIESRSIRIINGTYSGIINPQIPSTGGGGGARVTTGPTAGNSGTNGTNGGSGGGGSGANVGGTSGRGGTGTAFSGGSGGGGEQYWPAGIGQDAEENGGKGGIGGGNTGGGGGAGNPGGSSNINPGGIGSSGTGGVLIVIIMGTLSGSGSIVANGSNGGNAAYAGGGSGGGSVTILRKYDISTITPTANGGAGGTGTRTGGNGGAGTARKLLL